MSIAFKYETNFGFKMNMDFDNGIAPCKSCDKRHAGCHSSCISYISYSLAREDIYKKREKKGNLRDTAFNMRREAIKRSKTIGGRTGYAKSTNGTRKRG